MAYNIREVTEKNGLQTRAKVLETPQGKFVVLQTYEQLDGVWTPIRVGDMSGTREYQTVAGRLHGEKTEGGRVFSAAPLEGRESDVKAYVEKALRKSNFAGGISFW